MNYKNKNFVVEYYSLHVGNSFKTYKSAKSAKIAAKHYGNFVTEIFAWGINKDHALHGYWLAYTLNNATKKFDIAEL